MPDLPGRQDARAMQPNELLLACADIFRQRSASHGDYRLNIKTIAEFWSLYLTHVYGHIIAINEEDVCHMMALLKISRAIYHPENTDNYQDAAVYEVMGACFNTQVGGTGGDQSQDP